MREEETPRKYTKSEWCKFIIIAVVIMTLSIVTAFSILPQYPSANSREGCVSELKRYMQDPLGKVTEGFEIISDSDTIRVRNLNTNVEYICTTLENGELIYSSYIPSGVAYILSVLWYTLVFIGVYALAGTLIFAIGSLIIECHKENKHIKECVAQQEEESN